MPQTFKNMQSLYKQNSATQWDGTEPDGVFVNSSDLKPVYPECEHPQQFQFAEVLPNPEFRNQDTYIKARFDADNQVIPERRAFDHDSGAVGDAGRFGNLLFADSDQAGTGASMNGYNEIPYGTGAGFPDGPTVVSVDDSKADRGRES